MQHELVTIAFSHYCEKARWALDRFGVPYRERRFMPLMHMPAVTRRTAARGVGRADRGSTRFSTPLLRTAQGELITDSSDILAWVDARYASGRLYRPAGTAELVRELSGRFGADTRRVAYLHLLSARHLLQRMADDNVSRRQALAFRLVAPVIGGVIGRALRVEPEAAARSLSRIRQVLDDVAARIQDGRPYLLGDELSAADITFASLLAPAIFPEEYGAAMPSVSELPEGGRRLVEQTRAHPAGQLALRLYREERRPGASA